MAGTTNSPSETSGGNQKSNPTGTGNLLSANGGLGTGATAGIAEMKLLASGEPWESYKPSDKKQVVPVSSGVSQKLEQRNGSMEGYASELHSEPVVGSYSDHSNRMTITAELYSSDGQADDLKSFTHGNPVELHASPRNQNAGPVKGVCIRTSNPPGPPPLTSQPQSSEQTLATNHFERKHLRRWRKRSQG
ncbi:hypothetical protein P171DRAFT_490102 [Karstenula rhodostoma CBS 690.94]|uniref:Uncharacterized protein n=1 Tax=Karstenula rhodostoma CBS 690.94 TaxID=1392251 RepID=A0A9P4U5U2_9PLEO|nr:hypothetical protein P171DRAFT_490102 [Karstenula rhodostoma CBS 690.94]